MKRFIISIAAAALVMSACVKENAPVQNIADENLVPMEFSASADTKTVLVPGDGAATVNWCSTDKISVWDGTANREFSVKSCEGSSAVFTGMVSADATTFYAVYPYTADLEISVPDNTERDIRIRFPFSATQYLKAGSFPEGGAFAVAKAADGKLAFQNRTALIKFSLAEDMANVKSIAIAGNAGTEWICGTVNVEYAGDTVYQGIAYTGRGATVTFCNEDGSNLQTGVDYYMALPGVNFSTGFTITLTCDDNTTLSKTSDKALQIMSKQIYPLASAPISKSMFEAGEEGGEDAGDPATSYYAAYTAGQDIMIAGKAYNKSVYGEGTLVKAGETVDLTSGGKVYFVEPGAVSKIGPSNSATKYIVIGDDPTQRTTVTQAASIKVGQTSAHYAFMNLDIDMQITATGGGNDVMTVVNNNSTVERIAFDNCRLEYPTNGRQFIYKGDSGTSFKDMAFHSCDFVFTVTDSHAYILKVDSSTAEHGRFDFYNNVFWHTSSFGSAKGFNIIAGATNATIDELVFKSNTFVNMKTQSNASAYFTIKKDGENVPTVDIQNNIFYSTVADCNEFLLRNSADAGTCKDNVAYMGETGKTCHPFGNGTPSGMTKFTQLTESPFASIDLENGKFVKADAYKSYGATR